MNILLLCMEPHVAFMFFNEQKRDNASSQKRTNKKDERVHDAPKINISKLLRNLTNTKKSYLFRQRGNKNKQKKIENWDSRDTWILHRPRRTNSNQTPWSHSSHHCKLWGYYLHWICVRTMVDGVSLSKSLNGLLYWNLPISTYRMFNIVSPP